MTAGFSSRKVGAGQSGKLPEVCLVPRPIVDAVIAAVCDVCSLDPRRILDTHRHSEVVQARFMVIFLLRAVWGESAWTPEFGREWATWEQIALVVRREYTTAIHAFAQADLLFRYDKAARRRLLRALDLLVHSQLPNTTDYERVADIRERVASL